jgi:hypothetical protein
MFFIWGRHTLTRKWKGGNPDTDTDKDTDTDTEASRTDSDTGTGTDTDTKDRRRSASVVTQEPTLLSKASTYFTTYRHRHKGQTQIWDIPTVRGFVSSRHDQGSPMVD